MSFSKIISLRHQLHRHPELSGSEEETAKRILEFFEALNPDQVLSNIGGHGLAFVFSGDKPGPRVLLRCELDALPIKEHNKMSYCSNQDHVSHKCGHDGHMAIIAAVGLNLSQQRPDSGQVVLLFQPAEETGAGAAAVIADPLFSSIKPDYAFALHNMPGFPMGQLLIGSGTFNCASRGMIISLSGRTAHAAQPETGQSPALAMCRIITQISEIPKQLNLNDELVFTTVVGSKLGNKAFGTAPADAEIFVTLRCEKNHTMRNLVHLCETLVKQEADVDGLDVKLAYEDVFPATVNTQDAVRLFMQAGKKQNLKVVDRPFRWSEDFGRFTELAEGALFGLGSGENTPDLHDPEYDFPDELISSGSKIFLDLISECLNADEQCDQPNSVQCRRID